MPKTVRGTGTGFVTWEPVCSVPASSTRITDNDAKKDFSLVHCFRRNSAMLASFPSSPDVPESYAFPLHAPLNNSGVSRNPLCSPYRNAQECPEMSRNPGSGHARLPRISGHFGTFEIFRKYEFSGTFWLYRVFKWVLLDSLRAPQKNWCIRFLKNPENVP